MKYDASYWIDKLGLIEHPEGGYYRETYRAGGRIPGDAAAADHPAGRAYSTAIYFLLRSSQVSTLHRLRSDEVFHHYAGATFVIHVLGEDGTHHGIRLGSDVENGEVLQAVVRAGNWFGSEVAQPDTYSLVGCTVAPGFDFADFELGERTTLSERFPRHRQIVERLTPETRHAR